MPKSVRQREVVLTRTGKQSKSREAKSKTVADIQGYVDKYQNVYVFSFENQRSQVLQELRTKFKDTTRFLIGKNKLMQIALGRDEATEYAQNLHLISERITGQVGLMFTNEPAAKVEAFFKTYAVSGYARSGFKATRKVVLDAGPYEDLFDASQQPNLQKLGLPVQLKRGVVYVTSDFVVCEKGDILTPERAKIVEFMGIQLAEFRVILTARWSKDGSFQEL